MKDPLYGNKVAAAILVTLLLAVGLPIILGTLTAVFAGHHGAHHDEENPWGLAYTPTEITVDGATEAVAEVEVDLGTLLANASAERGERAAGLCGACHTFEKGGSNGIGPNLWGVMGREVAGVSGYGYSAALQSVGGEWTYEKVDHLLENSQSFAPGTSMAQMVRKDDKRADILAYLQTLSDNPMPFPEPAPVAEPEGEEGDDAADASGDEDNGGDN
ncbi:c-type cytochrome [Parvularcula sp. LCG005]|uniref:c-type cytochrome n=1 Tax=Parvularcula sp. LCG005 TaxID=3078805 RepID=UPI002941C47F|nr:c-type cytochrome [Parvularcula sp. LCG005]WOI53165.1 c-type cytochrome [Parvularcula sp. LCG005]